MKDKPSPKTAGELPSLTPTMASRLLRLGLSESDQPVDLLLERVQAAEGARWFASAVTAVFGESAGRPGAELLSPATTLARLRLWKRQCTALAEQAADQDSWLQAMLGYFLAVAAALAHHQAMITDRPPGEAQATLAKLAAAVPLPWSNLLSQASRNARSLETQTPP
ncbi:MAG TPA: hypothetical protein PKK06_06980 [Phycisphaerae bacterium]|nr:hypothetical protein [Phycisphaerae bacterium]HNU46897.1 hypothetical protein [Phycisphaerae bacterium]